MSTAWGGFVPSTRRCSETRAHYAHEWFQSQIRVLCPGGPDEVDSPTLIRRWFEAARSWRTS